MMKMITVDVEVDLADFNDDDLLEEIKERGLTEFNTDSDIVEMFYAFKLGKDDRAIELAKKIAMDHTGKIL